MKKIVLIIAAIIFVFISFESHAQLFPTLGGQRAGISTAQFLKIGVGGRASAMGESFIAVANDASALYWNPAGVVQFEQHQVIFSHNQWVGDISHDFLGVVYHFDAANSIGASLISLSMKDMPVTTEFSPFGTGEYFGFSDFAFAITYSRKMTDKFSFGGTIRYIEETLDKLKMRGVMIDLGTYYWTGLGSSRFAVTVTNFGNNLAPDGEVILIGKRKKSEWQAFEPFENEEHSLTSSIQLNHPNDNSENVTAGFEYNWKKILYLRGGYKFNVDEQNISFGAGFCIPVSFTELNLDYAYSNFVRLGSAHRFSIILGL